MPDNPKIVATIEARMTSSRLPGKVLLPADDRPMLWHLVSRLKAVSSIDEIVLATTTNQTDDVLVAFAEQQAISCFRGSEDDVMQRVVDAADSANADIVVEITGDCPIIDPQLIDQAIRMFLLNDCAYLSNGAIRSYPDGMDVQVFALDTLKDSLGRTDEPLDHEHVTLHIRQHPELYPRIHVVAPSKLHWPELGLTLDETLDYELLKRIIEHFPTNYLFSCEEVVELLRQHPDWVVNAQVTRKGDT